MRTFLQILIVLFAITPLMGQGVKPSATPKPKSVSTPAELGAGKPAISEVPLPCILTANDLPEFFGVKLGMPMDTARKLYANAPRRKIDLGPGTKPPPTFSSIDVPVKFLPKKDIGFPVESLNFTSIRENKVESMGLQLSRRQTLSSPLLFEKISKMLNMSPEVWLLVNHGNGEHMSWRAYCDGFHVQFDAQKNSFYRLWIAETYSYPKPNSKPDIGDGE